MVGIGAALSNTLGGLLIVHFGYRVSFLGLAGIALLAFALLWVAVPETLNRRDAGSGFAPESISSIGTSKRVFAD
jgi:predicted MFS family arabinose efflux permease